MKFDKMFFKSDKNLFVAIIYIPPISCTKNQSAQDLWEKLEESISIYDELGHVLLLGDFNARAGRGNETLEYSSFNDFDIHFPSTLPERNSKDKVANLYGRKLLDICCHTNLAIW